MLKKLIISVFVLVITVAIAGLAVRSMALAYLDKPLAKSTHEQLLLQVKRGDTARSISARVNQHFARTSNTLDYRLAQFFIGVDRIQAGLYEISPADSWQQFWQKLARGDEKQFKVTLIEGLRFSEWLQQLKQQPYLSAELKTDSLSEQLPFLQDYPSPEGLFLPETYSYRAHTSDLELLTQAHEALERELEDAWRARNRECPVSTPYELLILASIIEKETGIDGERETVASVFCNRLNNGMRLQSDPTTIYGIDDFDGNLTRQHLRTKTPYNTYRIDGLPPTPIAMVSAESLAAAAQPAQTDYFYFVADNSGGHVFSKTLEEHNRAVYKYQIKPHQQDKE